MRRACDCSTRVGGQTELHATLLVARRSCLFRWPVGSSAWPSGSTPNHYARLNREGVSRNAMEPRLHRYAGGACRTHSSVAVVCKRLAVATCALTLPSSGHATAGHAWPSFHSGPRASRRCVPLMSNVNHHEKHCSTARYSVPCGNAVRLHA